MSSVFDHFRRGFGENVRFALLAVRTHKLRAGLTVLGIVVGVATVIAMVSIVTGFNNNMVRNFQSFGATLVQFQKYEARFGPGHRGEDEKRRKDLTYEDALALKAAVPEMRAVSPERYLWNTDVHVRYRDAETTTPVVLGATPDYSMANNHFVGYGRFVTESDLEHGSNVMVIGQDVRQALFAREDPLNKSVTLNGTPYVVIGVFDIKGKMMGRSNDNFVLLPFTAFDHQFPFIKTSGGDTIHIATVPYRPDQVAVITEKGRAVLRTRRHVPFNKPDDFAIFTPDKMIESFQGITRGITFAMIFIAFISLLIGGVGVMNIMLVSVTERTREIGVRKAVGAFRRDIVLQFLTEATTLSLIGGAIGVVAGIAIPALVKRAFDALPAETPVWAVVVGLLVSLSVGIFFGLYPAVKASRLDPIEALRYE
ncbi:MAG: ABC transporter permease [Acidobacteria bacterium]|nr:ABC transporter permease [Acidobacteriota bacterium]MCA1610757.1 ABC transporter permease [Acidobacteriota bacterium]